MVMEVNCPTCGKTVVWSKSSEHRPFCSKRCQLIDLGEWASESHSIPGRQADEELLSDQWQAAQQQHQKTDSF